jgi:cyanophycinase
LLICGGGDMEDKIWNRFIALAGGKQADFVFITTAQPDPKGRKLKDLDRLKSLGVANIQVFGHLESEAAHDRQFLDALHKANGVWLMGGRQWKYVDAYENTPVVALIRDMLARGGVVGGTSAGAAIQADLMVRGSPLGNQAIAAEGYQSGWALLPGVAIDIHVAQRNRLGQLSTLISTYPQYLGIGLDEDTAIEVHGSSLSVYGKGKVHIVRAKSDGANVLELKEGNSFDLAKR